MPNGEGTCEGCGRAFGVPVVVPTDEGCRKCGHTRYAHTTDFGLGRMGCAWKHPAKVNEGCLCLNYESRRLNA